MNIFYKTQSTLVFGIILSKSLQALNHYRLFCIHPHIRHHLRNNIPMLQHLLPTPETLFIYKRISMLHE